MRDDKETFLNDNTLIQRNLSVAGCYHLNVSWMLALHCWHERRILTVLQESDFMLYTFLGLSLIILSFVLSFAVLVLRYFGN